MPFEEILGQDRVIRTLRNGLSSGKLPHAYLFYGIPGVGRFTTARALAKALFCANREHDFCGACLDCSRVDQEIHPDLTVLRPLVKGDGDEWEVDPELGQILIHQVRELERWLAVRTFHGGWRVCVFDGAEKINQSAANALLKTLEEPPPQSLLVLVSTSRARLPPTIQSRCHALYFPPLPESQIADFLAGRVEASREELAQVAALAEGSPGKALGLERDWVFRERVQWMTRFLDFLAGRARESLVDFVEELARSDNVPEVLDLLASGCRDLAVFQATGDRVRVLNRDLLDGIETAVGRDAADFAGKAALIQRTKEELYQRVRFNARVILEGMMLHLLGDAYPGRGPQSKFAQPGEKR
jgi:DNA polymerase III subunit delta'